MPQNYRAMKEDNGKPLTGQGSNTLGVRPDTDIVVQPDGTVHPDTGEISVAPSLYDLPSFKIPKRLHERMIGRKKPTGSNDLHIWKMGNGTFTDAPLALHLALRVDDPEHGLIEPDAVMPFDEYENALYATRDASEIDETGTTL